MAKETKRTKRPTALKRDSRNEKHRIINKAFKSRVRTAVRSFESILKGSDKALVQEKLNEVYSLLDQGAKRGMFKKNKASRLKSRFCARAAKV
ncbi:30S ribosomal protein S20 [Simkania negevensis]|uniref:Small ribosomal subunit protein bS20 n=1 Tax=Simkania negevensis TaxID=83561 RepID=A0ABS3AQS6_9BACT|nr:30S ribosomal protein S20 [Simkania negevensis]